MIVVVAGCGRLGFDPLASDASADALACIASGPSVDWFAGVMPADPESAPAESYSVSADGLVVTDRISGFVWQRAPDPLLATLAEAQSYCAGLVLEGCNAWRMPGTDRAGVARRSLAASPGDRSDRISRHAERRLWWTATPQSTTTNNAWAVNFVNGNWFNTPVTGQLHARCVSRPGRHTAARPLHDRSRR